MRWWFRLASVSGNIQHIAAADRFAGKCGSSGIMKLMWPLVLQQASGLELWIGAV